MTTTVNATQNQAQRIDKTNATLKGWDGLSKANGDNTSAKARTAAKLVAIDKQFKDNLRGIEGDTTMTDDAKTLALSDATDEAERDFQSTANTYMATINTSINAAASQLFSNNLAMGDADIAILSNPVLSEMLLDSPLDFMDLKANANVLIHLSNRGFYKGGQDIKDGLNRRHTPEAHAQLSSLETYKSELTDIVNRQEHIFNSLRPFADKVAKIRANKYKGK